MKNYIFVAVNRTKWNRKRKYFHSTRKNFRKTLPKCHRKWYSVGKAHYCDIKSGRSENNMHTVFDIANWFLKKQSMTHKKLQKMCYYAQAWSYALKNRPIMDAKFEAWVHGPVCRELYEKYKGNYLFELTADSDFDLHFSPGDEELLESVFETYGEFSGNALEVLTHSETPWINARSGCSSSERCNKSISAEDMKQYYKSIYIGDAVPDA